MLHLTRGATASESPVCRALACTLLAHPLFVGIEESDQIDGAGSDAWDEAMRLVGDSDEGVRAAALRGVGLRVKRGGVEVSLEIHVRTPIRRIDADCLCLSALQDDGYLHQAVAISVGYCMSSESQGVQISATWTLANACDQLTSR